MQYRKELSWQRAVIGLIGKDIFMFYCTGQCRSLDEGNARGKLWPHYWNNEKSTMILEAIQFMNDSEYGLTAAVYSSSKDRADQLFSQLDAGTVYWNCCDRVSAAVPWSGCKHSGIWVYPFIRD